jgi:hypothetical protein
MKLFELLFPKKASRIEYLEFEKERLEFREKFLEGEIEALKGVKLSYDEHALFNMLITAYGKNNHNNIPVTIYIKDCYEAIMWLRDKK